MKTIVATDRLMVMQAVASASLPATERAERVATKTIASVGGSQRGVALFVALIMLVIISILGIAALRSSVTNARITTGIQAGTLSFQAAQSAINAAANEMIGPTAGQVGNLLTDMITARSGGNITIQNRCVTANSGGTPSTVEVAGSCSSSQTVDTRGLVQASSQSFLQRDMLPAPGWALSGPGAYGYNQIVIVGSGSVPAVGISNLNIQQLALLGPKPQGSLD